MGAQEKHEGMFLKYEGDGEGGKNFPTVSW